MSENQILAETKEVLGNIIENYKSLEESIVSQLNLSNKCHGYTTGSSRESIWLQLFEQIIPKKFQIEQSVFIIDSEGRRSKEVDLAIIDHMYTPYIFHYGRLKFVPIEAVAAVIECKSESIKKEDLKKWCESIESLRTSRNSIARIATNIIINNEKKEKEEKEDKKLKASPSTQTSTRPIRILCDYKQKIPEDGIPNPEDFFDFTIVAGKEGGRKRIKVELKKMANMDEWYKELNHYRYEGDEGNIKQNDDLKEYKIETLEIKSGSKEISLLTLNFQLNQLLILINNPILFPHRSYVELFNKILGQKEL